MIISKLNSQIEIRKSQVEQTATALTQHLDKWPAALPKITAGTFKEFALDPKAYYLKVLTELGTEKLGVEVDPVEYAKLIKVSYFPDLVRFPINVDILDHVKLGKGNTCEPVKGYLENIHKEAAIEVTDPEEVEAAKLLMKTYVDFLYLENLLSSAGNPLMMKTAAMVPLGFTPMQIGQLKPEAVKQLTALMKDHPRSEFAKRIAEESGNESFISL